MSYVDGFVLVIKKKDTKKYKDIAKKAGKAWMKHGAVSYMECIGDDLNPEGFGLTFTKMAKCKEDETVWFSFILFKSKTDRNRVNKKVMSEMDKIFPNMKPEDMPVDMKKMAYGGFKPEVEFHQKK